MKATALSLALVCASVCCHADSLGSYATGAPNMGNINTATNFGGFGPANTILGGVGNTYTLLPAGVWINPGPHSTWVGYAPTAGPGGINPPGSLLAPDFYTFTTGFMETGDWHGLLGVAADDTTDVFLNGVLQEADGVLGTDTHCSAGAPNCSVVTFFAISGHGGPNTLSFVVEQGGFADNNPSGLDFTGEITTVPEPSALVLVGSGLLIFGRFVKKYV
jgi:hypothetical protein